MADINPSSIEQASTVPANLAGAVDPTALDNPNANGQTDLGLMRDSADIDSLRDQASLLARAARGGVSIGELIASLPLVFTTLIGQSENIAKQEIDENHSHLIGFIVTTIKTLSYPFRWLFDKFVPQGEHDDDVTVNKKPFIYDNISQRVMQKSFANQVTSFIFALRRTFVNFFPYVFTVPSEEHDPDNPQGKTASGFSASFFSAFSTILSPFRFVAAALTALFALPSHSLGAFFSYLGEQKSYDFSKHLSQISNHLMPLTTNLSALYRVSKAYLESWNNRAQGLTKQIAFGKYNINFAHVVQGVVGSVLAIPHFFAAILQIKNKLVEKENDLQSGYTVTNKVRDFVGDVALGLMNFDFFRNETVTSLQDRAARFTDRTINNIVRYSNNLVDKVMNASPGIQNFFAKFRPRDASGHVRSGYTYETLQADVSSGRLAFGLFKKGEFFNELFDILHPIQSMLMLLPNAFINMSDPYIQDNGKRLLRVIDRLVGVNSMILSFPNYLIYGLKNRFPQLFLKYYELKQRKYDAEGVDYDAYNDYQTWVDKLKNSGFIGTGYLSTALQKLDMRPGSFRDSAQIKEKFSRLDEEASEQENSVKASELVKAIRIGFRHLLGKKIFFAERNEEGLTAEEQAKDKVYEAMGKFSTSIRGFPVVGWVVSPIVEMFRSMYKIKRKDKITRLPGTGPSVTKAAQNPAQAAQNMLSQMAA